MLHSWLVLHSWSIFVAFVCDTNARSKINSMQPIRSKVFPSALSSSSASSSTRLCQSYTCPQQFFVTLYKCFKMHELLRSAFTGEAAVVQARDLVESNGFCRPRSSSPAKIQKAHIARNLFPERNVFLLHRNHQRRRDFIDIFSWRLTCFHGGRGKGQNHHELLFVIRRTSL